MNPADASPQPIDEPSSEPTFANLGLRPELLAAIAEVGYDAPTPIQARTIPPLLAGRDLIGQAQTGTGKTAAFALPLLQRLELSGRPKVQALVLAPTRELAIQVAEAVHTYGKALGRVSIVPIYGGQPIGRQLMHLERGAHVVVGTPGRVMDHLRRGSLSLEHVRVTVLDEADEMLRMGFLEDVEWILSQAPAERQTALFSATLPPAIRAIAAKHLRDPVSIGIENKRQASLPAIEQRYLSVLPDQKLDVLARLLETEDIDAVLVFARTKTDCAGLADRLEARGYAAEAIHGDMNQSQRESVIRRLKNGQVEILVATDVAARGLDIDHISHVVNFDIPYDPETYVHRIGRTGRAGRTGTAILLVTPRERRMMMDIERFTGQRLTPMKPPTQADVATRRIAQFKDTVKKTLETEELDLYVRLMEEVMAETGRDAVEVAAAAARVARGSKPLEVPVEPAPERSVRAEVGMVRLFVSAGRQMGLRPADIVGAFANQAGVPGRAIGAIDLYDDFTFVDLPGEFVAQVLDALGRTRFRNRPVVIRVATAGPDAPEAPPARKAPLPPPKAPAPPALEPARPAPKSVPKLGPKPAPPPVMVAARVMPEAPVEEAAPKKPRKASKSASAAWGAKPAAPPARVDGSQPPKRAQKPWEKKKR